MIAFSLIETARLLGGVLQGADASYSRVSTDSRSLQPGELFVALRGENFDGHRFVDDVARLGACAALVDEAAAPHASLPLLRVGDTLRALGELAAAWRQRAAAHFIGITGSNGKTTLKEMIASILRQGHQVLATRGNLNNHIGMPLTLLQVQEQDYAVIEMGANHPGEIAYLSGICRPQVAVLNNAGRAHLEGFGSLEGVARAKAEIVQGLQPGGTFVFNADDRFAGLWRELAQGHRQLGFGLGADAQVRSRADSYSVEWTANGFDAVFEVETPRHCFEVRLGLGGEHNRMNALAAIAATSVFDIGPEAVQQGLAELQPVPGRLYPQIASGGARLVDDSYNANPDSVLAALRVLAAAPGRRTLVLGDLGELGPRQQLLHAELGQQAQAEGIDRLLSCGRLSRAAADAFDGDSRHFDDRESLIEFLQRNLDAGDSVLVKGSRTSAMDKVVKALCAREAAC